MPATFSTFASTVQGETAFTVLAVARRLLAAGKDVIELEIGDSPFPTSPAALAAGGRPVVALSGDGGFNMTLGELETARRLGLGVTVAVVNNAASGYVKALQHAMYGGRYQSSDLSETDYAAAARALGCHGVRVEDPAHLDAAFAEAVAERGRPSVVDVVVTRDPAQMLPGIDSRTAAPKIQPGDRIA